MICKKTAHKPCAVTKGNHMSNPIAARQTPVISPCDETDAKRVLEKLRAYNRRYFTDNTDMSFCMRDAAGELIGGIVACRDFDCLTIDYLCVDEAYRGQGYGEALIRHAEEAARKQGAKRVLLNTFSFQAPEFYKKLGYRVFGEVVPCFGPYGQYFMTKEL